MILGTPRYMAPEQLEGKDVDARADLFALGAIVYEMVTGTHAFEGGSVASIVAAILERDPAPMSALAPLTPPALDDLVKSCLAKDPDDRWQSALDLGRELKRLRSGRSSGASEVQASTDARKLWRRALPWALAILASGLAAVMAWQGRAPAAVGEADPIQSTILAPPDTYQAFGLGQAISPDGRLLALTAVSHDGQRQLWIRPLAAEPALESTGLADTKGLPHQQPEVEPANRAPGGVSECSCDRATRATRTCSDSY